MTGDVGVALSLRRVITWSALLLTGATLVALGFAERRQFFLGTRPPDLDAKSHLVVVLSLALAAAGALDVTLACWGAGVAAIASGLLCAAMMHWQPESIFANVVYLPTFALVGAALVWDLRRRRR
ncbi:MAG TPA: hypothetical protein VFK56_18560 [Mycobacterium sp.]|nr:hypothetical protein [Mycobacterium sp.]